MGRSHNLRGEPSLGLLVKKRNIGAPFWHAVLAVVLVERASREGKCGGCEQVPARTRTCRPPIAMGDGDRVVSWQVRAGGGGGMRRGARAQGRRGRYRGIGNRRLDSTRRFLGYLWWFEIHVMAKNVLHRCDV